MGAGVALRASLIIRRGVRIIAGISRVRRRGWAAGRCARRLLILNRFRLSDRRSDGVGDANERVDDEYWVWALLNAG